MRKKTTQILCGVSIALLAALCVGCSPQRITKVDIERDLAIEAELLSEATILPGQHIVLRMSLVNRSKRKSYLVVRPGDGSGVTSGLRDRQPYVFFSAQRQQQDGNWVAVPTCEYSYLPDISDWRKDVIELKAGERLALKDWLPLPSRVLELQKPGRVHLHVHYQFSPQFMANVGRNNTVVTLRTAEGKSQRLPPFEIISDPIELNVYRPLNLHAEAISPLKIGIHARLSEVLRVELSNVSDAPIKVKSPRLRATTLLRFETSPWRRLPRVDTSGSANGPEIVLVPGGVVSLLGDGEFANGTDGLWTCPDTNTIRLRAVYTTAQYASADDGPISVIKSDWTTVRVVE